MIGIAITLFCSKPQWAELIANGITPFLLENQRANLIEGYIIEFNYSNGENIRFSLLATENGADNLREKAQLYFTDFIAKLNKSIPCVPISEKDASPFFKKNTIQFKLHPALNMQEEYENINLSISLSQIIIEAFKNDPINEENILSLAFYLQVGLIKVTNNIVPNFVNGLKSQFFTQSFDSCEKDKMSNDPIQNVDSETDYDEDILDSVWQDFAIHQKFEKNKEILSEIARDIMETNSQSHLFPWLKKWLCICKNEVDRANRNNILMRSASVISTVEVSYLKLMGAVFQHLGISIQTKTMLTYFIQRILGMINPPDVLIIGAQKCGTTTLHHSLLTHPKIDGPIDPESHKTTKEVDFFNRKFGKGLAWYFSHFLSRSGLFLDSSPNYLASTKCFSLMKVAVPNPKIIICLRDPVYRAYSQYNHYSQNISNAVRKNAGWLHDKDFFDNIKAQLQDIKVKLNRSPTALENETDFSGFVLRGVYIYQINQILKYYDRSQIYISITDRWHSNYENELDNIITFLGLEKEGIVPIIKHKRDYTVEPFKDEVKEILTEFYKPYNQKLFDFLGYDIPEWMR